MHSSSDVVKFMELTPPATFCSSSAAEPIANDLIVKHPLQYCWTLWYYKNDRSKNWQDNLREVKHLAENW